MRSMRPSASVSARGGSPVRSILLYTAICGSPSTPTDSSTSFTCADALGAFRVGGVDHVQQQVRLAGLLQRRAEGRHQLVRQVAHEADGVRERNLEARREVQPAHGRVEGREQLVGGVGVGGGEAVEERGLARIGVSDQRHRGNGAPLALLARGLALHQHLVEAVVEGLDAPRQQAAVGLELGLAGPAQADAALLALEVRPTTHQSRRHVLELGEFDLQLAFEAARALREDVEDQAAAVEHAALEGLFEVALLAR